MATEKIRFLFFNVLVVLLLAIFLEALAWLGIANPKYIPSSLVPHFQRVYLHQDRSIIQVTSCARYDPELFYTLNPGSCTFKNREFEVQTVVNSAGLRDDHQSLHSPPVVVLGDSYAMGWGVGQDEAFPQVLERISGQKVLNAGISSYGTAREMMMLDRINTTAMKYLIIQYHRNDYEENVTYVNNNYTLPVRSRLQYDSLKTAIAQRATYFPFKYLSGITLSVIKTMVKPSKPDTVDSATEARIFLDLLARAVPPRDSLTIIVFRADVPEPLRKDRFIATLDSLIKTDDYFLPNMITFRADDLLANDDYFILDDHINASGHQKIAQKLNEYVKGPPHTVGTRILVKDHQ